MVNRICPPTRLLPLVATVMKELGQLLVKPGAQDETLCKSVSDEDLEHSTCDHTLLMRTSPMQNY